MPHRFAHLVFLVVLVLLIMLSTPASSKAGVVVAPDLASTPYELINAVNALRASYGVPAYSISSILMFTAQSQADFMAATGNVTHTGAGGSSVTDRILAAGYPLAGDLSLGGFRSENITGGGEGMSAQDAVNQWTGDAPHLNTMISPSLTEIGAGVTVANGRVYYVIDAARPTTSGAPQVAVTVVEGGSTIPAVEAVIFPVIVGTPNADGDVIHEVMAGQTLWQIAIAYEVKIDDIKRLNNLFDNNIYPGDKLLVKKRDALSPTPTASPTESPTAEISPSATVMDAFTATPFVEPSNTPVLMVTSDSAVDNNMIMSVVIGILALALLGGGVFTWLGNTKKE